MYFRGELFTLLTSAVVSVISGFAINLTDIEVNEETTKNITGPLLLNLFDSLTNLTEGVDILFDEFEDGFEDIRPSNYSDLEENNTTDNTSTPLSGSSVVVGLFDALRDITGDVGDVVTDLGAGLTDKRPGVIEAAHHVDNKVGEELPSQFFIHQQFPARHSRFRSVQFCSDDFSRNKRFERDHRKHHPPSD